MFARALLAVLEREFLKLIAQRGRLLAAMVRPLLWLLVIGSGVAALQSAAGAAGYQRFLVPGVLGMTLLFGAILAALSSVYDKESGVMRMLVIAPVHHGWIVVAKALSAALVAIVQAAMLLALLAVLGYLSSQMSIGLAVIAIFTTALACASLGMLIAAWSGTLENYATMMNLVIFPVFFLSGSLYPVQHLPAPLRLIATLNPYTHGVDLLRHAAIPDAASRYVVDFTLGTDLAVLLGFSACALAIAGMRFSREAANEPLIHRLTAKHGS